MLVLEWKGLCSVEVYLFSFLISEAATAVIWSHGSKLWRVRTLAIVAGALRFRPVNARKNGKWNIMHLILKVAAPEPACHKVN